MPPARPWSHRALQASARPQARPSQLSCDDVRTGTCGTNIVRYSSLVQRSFDDLGTPLHEVTFCVLDLETTGGSPQADAITEIGAVRCVAARSSARSRPWSTPGWPIPAGDHGAHRHHRGDAVSRAASSTRCSPPCVEFVGGAVLVGHNIRFDVSFLDAALVPTGRPPLGIHRVDTVRAGPPARRATRCRNCKLGTLAERFRLDHRPTHRALDDALATVDLLHLLLERAAAFGVAGLDDLLASPTMAGPPPGRQAAAHRPAPPAARRVPVPRPAGRPLYVGKATDLRSRVRSLVRQRRRPQDRAHAARGARHRPRRLLVGPRGRRARSPAARPPRPPLQPPRHPVAQLSLRQAHHQRVPRLAVVRAPRRDGAQYLGPLVSTRVARMVVEAIETAVPLRSPAKGHDSTSPAIVGGLATPPEVADQLLDGDDRALGGEHRHLLHPGDAPELHVAGPGGPLAEGFADQPSQLDEAVHRQHVQTVVRGFTDRHDLLLEPLRERIDHLAAVGRVGEAQIVRDRYTALARALRRQRRFASLRQAGRIVIDLPGGGGAELDRGRLLRAWGPDGPSAGPTAPLPGGDRLGLEPVEIPPDEGPVPCDLADELHYVAAWLERHASRVRIVDVEGTFASPLPPIDVAPPRGQSPVVHDTPPPRGGLDPATAEVSGDDRMAAV